MNNILNAILNNTYTLSSLKHRVSILKSYLEQQIFSSQSQNMLPPPEWIKSLPRNFLTQFNKNNLQTIFEDMQKEINTLNTLTIYLTFDPDEQTLTQLGEYVRKTFGKITLLDVKYDPNLIAGTALVWKGLYKDYSLRSKIDDRKEEILKSFRAFLR